MLLEPKKQREVKEVKSSLSSIRPAWLEIDLDALEYNTKSIKKYIGNSKLMAVVKADAYSHGAVEVSTVSLEAGADYLAVATLDEGIELRINGIKAPILIFGYTPASRLNEVVFYDLEQTIYDYDLAKALSYEAQKQNKSGLLHIKVDTGMSRLGFFPNFKSIEIINDIYHLPNLEILGIFSHFAHSEDKNKNFTNQQFLTFTQFTEALENKLEVKIPLHHISNAAAMIDQPEYNLDMVRIGISMVGLYPSGLAKERKVSLEPTLELKSQIAYVKTVPKNTNVGYNQTYTTDKETKIATLPIGYADGYTEEFSNIFPIVYNNQVCPVIGRLCMDQMMIDITGLDLKIGDTITILGRKDRDGLGARHFANLSNRLPRVYYRNGKIIKIKEG